MDQRLTDIFYSTLSWLQANSGWLQATLSWLQANSGWLQAIAAFIAMPVTVYGAILGARRGAHIAYKLSEESALLREERAQGEKQKAFMDQKQSVRLLLKLEIERNLDDLKWLYDNLISILGEGNERYYRAEDASIEESEKYAWIEARQHFISLYMPEWSHRFWYSQHSSHLLPLVLDQTEIRQIQFIHSQLDRLTKIKDMLAQRAQQDDRGPSKPASTDVGEAPMLPAIFKKDAPLLWEDFITTLHQLIDLDLPLREIVLEPFPQSVIGSSALLTKLPDHNVLNTDSLNDDSLLRQQPHKGE